MTSQTHHSPQWAQRRVSERHSQVLNRLGSGDHHLLPGNDPLSGDLHRRGFPCVSGTFHVVLVNEENADEEGVVRNHILRVVHD